MQINVIEIYKPVNWQFGLVSVAFIYTELKMSRKQIESVAEIKGIYKSAVSCDKVSKM